MRDLKDQKSSSHRRCRRVQDVGEDMHWAKLQNLSRISGGRGEHRFVSKLPSSPQAWQRAVDGRVECGGRAEEQIGLADIDGGSSGRGREKGHITRIRWEMSANLN